MARLLMGVTRAALRSRPKEASFDIVTTRDWTAVTLPVEPDEAQTEEGVLEWARQQNDCLSILSKQSDILPFSLGAVFSGDAALRSCLAAHDLSISQAYRRICGKGEYGLQLRRRASAPDAPRVPVQSGRAYLAAGRLRRDRGRDLAQRQAAFVQRLVGTLSTLPVDIRPRQSAGEGRLFSAALLCPRASSRDLITALHDQAEAAEALDLDCTLIGPGPAYSFAFAGVQLGEALDG